MKYGKSLVNGMRTGRNQAVVCGTGVLTNLEKSEVCLKPVKPRNDVDLKI